MTTVPTEHVLLIHGTNAADTSDSGEDWWQRDSQFWRRTSAALGPGYTVQPETHVFHWPGENSETCRRSAAGALARWMLDFEKAGMPYHLIGHSHGGSLVWRAIAIAHQTRARLPCLRSWSTIGTPFLHYRPRRLLAWLLLPGITAAVILPMIAPNVASFGQAFSEAIQDPARSLFAFVAVPLLWSLVAGMGLFAILRLFALLSAEWGHRAEQRGDRAAYADFASRHLGMWSDDDEAINGLASTLAAAGELVPRMKGRGTSLWRRAMSGAFAPLRWLYNASVARVSDEFVWDRVTRRLQGNDRFNFDMVDVTRAPTGDLAANAGLDAGLNDELTEAANAHAAETLAAARGLLGLAASAQPNNPGFLAVMKGSLTFNELVHTTYFRNDRLGALLTGHILTHSAGAPADSTRAGAELPVIPAGARPLRGSRPFLLAPVEAMAAAAIVLLAWVGCATLHAMSIDPYVRSTQISYVAAQDVAERATTGGDLTTYPLKQWGGALAGAGFAARAEQIAANLVTTESKLVVLAATAQALLKRGDDGAARAVLEKGHRLALDSKPDSNDDGYRAIARELAHIGHRRRAFEVAHLMSPDRDDWRAEAYGEIAMGQLDGGFTDQAVATLVAIPDPVNRVQAIEAVLRERANDSPERMRLADMLLAIAPTIPEKGNWRSSALATAAEEYSRTGKLATATAITRRIVEPSFRTNVLVAIAQRLTDAGRVDESLALLDEAERGAARPSVGLASALADLDRIRPNPTLRVRAATMLDTATTAAAEQHGGFSEVAIGAVASGWAHLGDVRRTFAQLEDTPSDFYKSSLLESIDSAMAALVKRGLTPQAKHAAASMQSVYHRCLALIGLADHVADQEERRRLLIAAEVLVPAVLNPEDQSYAAAQVAVRWIGLGQYRHGLLTGERARPFDRFDVYLRILDDYSKEQATKRIG